LIPFEDFNAVVGLPGIREADERYYAHLEDLQSGVRNLGPLSRLGRPARFAS